MEQVSADADQNSNRMHSRVTAPNVTPARRNRGKPLRPCGTEHSRSGESKSVLFEAISVATGRRAKPCCARWFLYLDQGGRRHRGWDHEADSGRTLRMARLRSSG